MKWYAISDTPVFSSIADLSHGGAYQLRNFYTFQFSEYQAIWSRSTSLYYSRPPVGTLINLEYEICRIVTPSPGKWGKMAFLEPGLLNIIPLGFLQ